MNNFLDSRGWRVTAPIPSDASLRRYTRVEKNGRTALLMDCTALDDAEAQVRDFIRIANWLNDAGLKAPEIYDADEKGGYTLIEDLGVVSFNKALAQGEDQVKLYRLATDVLRHMRAQKNVLLLPPYKHSFIDLGRRRIIDWYFPMARGARNREGIVQDYLKVWEKIENTLPPCPETFMHMDYHLDNMFYLPNGQGVRQCGLIDFQDAMKGPCVYDLANLLEDARIDVRPEIRGAMMALYVEDMERNEANLLREWTRLLATQFHCRWLGQLIKLALRSDKPQYLPQIPRLENYIRNALKAPVLKPLKQFFDDEGVNFSGGVMFDRKILDPLIAGDAA
ncbi:MAG: aminoglycoside phosphotransferase family protein [Alphaproteobacteria bacterium]